MTINIRIRSYHS